VHEIVLVGCSTRILHITSLISNLFNGKHPTTLQRINPNSAGAYSTSLRSSTVPRNASDKPQQQAVLLLDMARLSRHRYGQRSRYIRPEQSRYDPNKEHSDASDGHPGLLTDVYEGNRAHT
ncbi:hypothetical protein LXA43DRAFT_850873, partial [Ganoderma leucocontextum]